MKQFRGAGAIITSEESHRVLTVLRSSKESYPNVWTFPGGRLEQDETTFDALRRELKEELNLVEMEKILPLHRYQSRSKDFIYDTFIVLVKKEFIPILNWENSGYAWTSIINLPGPLHPKTRKMINSSRLLDKFINFNNWVGKKNGGKDYKFSEIVTSVKKS